MTILPPPPQCPACGFLPALRMSDGWWRCSCCGQIFEPTQKTDAEQLEAFLDHKAAQRVIETLRFDRNEWAQSELQGEEDYPGEARDRREALELLLELLTGEKPT